MFQRRNREALRFGIPPYDRPRLERWVSGLGGGILLLAIDQSNLVGVAMVFGRALSRMKGVGELVMYLHQDYQGVGLGTFLAKTLLESVESKGFAVPRHDSEDTYLGCMHHPSSFYAPWNRFVAKGMAPPCR